jgi:tartrate-resistant acid phosphatase type 5
MGGKLNKLGFELRTGKFNQLTIFWCSRIQFLTSGGGSKAWRGDVDWWNPEEMKFFYDGQGFMSVQITQTRVDIAFYDVFGNVLHKWDTSKQYYADA